jgi:hypothetical protein
MVAGAVTALEGDIVFGAVAQKLGVQAPATVEHATAIATIGVATIGALWGRQLTSRVASNTLRGVALGATLGIAISVTYTTLNHVTTSADGTTLSVDKDYMAGSLITWTLLMGGIGAAGGRSWPIRVRWPSKTRTKTPEA